jgi:hypothetical protein
MDFEAEKQFGLKGVEAQTDLEKSNIWTRKDLSVADPQALQAREGKNIEIDRHNAELELLGRGSSRMWRLTSGASKKIGKIAAMSIAIRPFCFKA